MATGYKIYKNLLPESHQYYTTDDETIDLEAVAEAYDTNFPWVDWSLNYYKSGMKFSAKQTTMTQEGWIKTIGNNQYKTGSSTSANFILKGTLPTFRKCFHTHGVTWEDGGTLTQVDIKWSKSSLKIGDSTYDSYDFRGGVIPNSIIVELQAGGGGGGGTIWALGKDASGGGGGAHAVAVITFDSAHSNWKFYVGGGGAGASGGSDAHTASMGLATSIRCVDVDNVSLLVNGGYGGSGHDYSNTNTSKGGSVSTGTANGEYINILLSCNGADGGSNVAGDSVEAGTAYALPGSTYKSNNNNYKTYLKMNGGGGNSGSGGGGASRSGVGGASGKNGNGSDGGTGGGGGGGERRVASNSGGGNGGNGFIKFYY